MDSISGVGVVDKVVAVLRALEANGPLSLIELQDATGMPRATAHRLASALEDHGLVRREANGKFALGMGLVSMGKAASSALPLTEIARPVLDTLRTTTGESVQLYMREGEGRRCVVSLESPHGLRWIVPEGALAVGAPATIKEGRARKADIEMAALAYLHKGQRFREQLRRID